ncbi:MAG: hypothetical protein GY861_05815 [bacterium]|nr:hypothetical protein [bacterium]
MLNRYKDVNVALNDHSASCWITNAVSTPVTPTPAPKWEQGKASFLTAEEGTTFIGLDRCLNEACSSNKYYNLLKSYDLIHEDGYAINPVTTGSQKVKDASLTKGEYDYKARQKHLKLQDDLEKAFVALGEMLRFKKEFGHIGMLKEEQLPEKAYIDNEWISLRLTNILDWDEDDSAHDNRLYQTCPYCGGTDVLRAMTSKNDDTFDEGEFEDYNAECDYYAMVTKPWLAEQKVRDWETDMYAKCITADGLHLYGLDDEPEAVEPEKEFNVSYDLVVSNKSRTLVREHAILGTMRTSVTRTVPALKPVLDITYHSTLNGKVILVRNHPIFGEVYASK